MRQSEARHMARVAGLGCILCRHLGIIGTPAEQAEQVEIYCYRRMRDE